MNILLYFLVVISLIGITIQDFKERKVFLWLFFFSGFFLGIIHFREVYYPQFFITALINCSIIFVIIFILFMYAIIVLKEAFKNTFGFGDFLFFIVLAIGFPTATFLVLFSFSILFSMMMYFLLKNRLNNKTVPLAGLQALFVNLVLTVNWVFNFSSLYAI